MLDSAWSTLDGENIAAAQVVSIPAGPHRFPALSAAVGVGAVAGPATLQEMQPTVGVADIPVSAPDGTFSIGQELFPEFEALRRGHVHVQDDLVRIAHPDRGYVQTALTALAEACKELDVPDAQIAFIDTVVPPPRFGLRYGFKGAYTTDFPTVIWVFANWTALSELRGIVRHEAAHLAFARSHTAEESAGHSGPSEDFALAFEAARA